MIKRFISVAAVLAVLMLAFVSVGKVSFPSPEAASYQVQAVADEKIVISPTRECNWAGCTFKFNKPQTHVIAGGASAVIAYVGGAASAAIMTVVQYPAQRAIDQGKCLQVTYRWIGLVGQVRIYDCPDVPVQDGTVGKPA